MKPATISLDRPVVTLTIGELQQVISETVRQAMREERAKAYYVNEDGVKVLYQEEDVAPEYLAQLNQDYEEIRSGRMPLTDGETVLAELRQLGVEG